MLFILPYKFGSKSAKALAEALSVKRIRPGSPFIARMFDTVINWGCSESFPCGGKILNRPEAVKLAVNKLSTFEALQAAGVNTPKFTMDVAVAREWQAAGYKVVARHKLTSYGGDGAQVVQPHEALPIAKLYVRYARKEAEYRVHVVRGQVIDFTEKKRSLRALSVDPYIRSHENGWVFCRKNTMLPQAVKDQAIAAVAALGLDFGGVDVGYRAGKAFVFEVNSAPGIEATTLSAYASALRSVVW